MDNRKPATFADIRLLSGDQGCGKSTIGTGLPIGAYYDELTGIMSASGEIVDASPLSKEDKLILKSAGVFPDKFKYVRVYSPDGRDSKIVKIPPEFPMVLSPVHIFANYHLYGVKYTHMFLADIIEHINTDLFDDGWILIDESGETSARSSMEALNKLGVNFYSSIRKRRAHFVTMAQYNGMVEKWIRAFATTRILCSYDEKSHYITCSVNRRGDPKFEFDVFAPTYWPFFNTEEKIEVPQYKIDKTLAPVYANR